jgi:hypothetical protein
MVAASRIVAAMNGTSSAQRGMERFSKRTDKF